MKEGERDHNANDKFFLTRFTCTFTVNALILGRQTCLKVVALGIPRNAGGVKSWKKCIL